MMSVNSTEGVWRPTSDEKRQQVRDQLARLLASPPFQAGRVEEWLGGIKRSRITKAKIRNLMSALFHHAMRYEWIERNPIELVRQSAKREKVPDVLELHELQLLLSKLAVRERTLALLDATTGAEGQRTPGTP